MTVLSHFTLRLAPDHVDDGMALLDRILHDTRAFSGCCRVTLAQDEADPASVLVAAEWDAPEDHDAYLAWRDGAGAVPELGDLLDGPPGGARFVVASVR